MASGGTLESIPGSFVLAVDPHVNTDVNDKKRPGNEVVEGDADRRVRPKVDVTPESPEKATEPEAEPEEGSQEELDKRLRALVEVAAQHKGDVSASLFGELCKHFVLLCHCLLCLGLEAQAARA